MKILQKLRLPAVGEVSFETPATSLVPAGARLEETRIIEVNGHHGDGEEHDEDWVTTVERHYDLDGDKKADVIETEKFRGREAMRYLGSQYLYVDRSQPGKTVFGDVALNARHQIWDIGIRGARPGTIQDISLSDSDLNGKTDEQRESIPNDWKRKVSRDLDQDGTIDEVTVE